MTEATIPGTSLTYTEDDGVFSKFIPMIQAADGLTLGQVCGITGLEPSTIQNWVKRGFVARPVNKKYHGRQLARILLIAALRDAMKLDSIGELMTMVNGNADDESDDIISEEKMYDYFCKISKAAREANANLSEISHIVKGTISDYDAPNEYAVKRLGDALNVMVYAYISAEYKRLAESRLQAMRVGTKEG